MNKLILSIFLVAMPLSMHSQELEDFVKISTESKMDFVLRVKPAEDNLTFEILESYEWDSKNLSIITFYETPREYENISEVTGHLYLKQYDVDYYRDIVFGNFTGETVYPEILDVFWMNIDEDKEKELFVLFKYYTRHYDFTGFVYDLAVFDNPTIDSDCLDSLDIFYSTFISFEGVKGDGTEVIPDYSVKEQIISRIKELGY